MLSTAAARQTAPRLARFLATGAATTTIVASTVVVYTHTERGLGFKREVDFWSSVAPVVWDYWWNSFQSSPKVKWKEACKRRADSDVHEQVQKEYDEERNELLNQLHERNAPRIYNVMLRLGGLYIKLGQVLSVTALPIPEKYREYFRSLQSNVPNHQDFASTVQPTLERELGAPLHEIFDSIDEIPCGAASIGQAHRATLKKTKEEVIVKVQYPDAKWQVPADIECIGDLLQLCVWFGIVDESASRLSYEEFERQFLSELDYENEVRNLKRVYQSSLDPRAPYLQKGVVLPRVFDEYCTKQVITMSYLPGRKFEEETKRQLSLLGVDTKKNIHSMIRESGDVRETYNDKTEKAATLSRPLALSSQPSSLSWKATISSMLSNIVGVDFLFTLVRVSRRIVLWSQGAAVKGIQLASSLSIVPPDWKKWADSKQHLILQGMRLDWTEEAVHTLFDVHGYQILNQGLFNADPHPGNIIVDFPSDANKKPKIGLIDYGQCKELTPAERVKIARLILSIAEKESDDVIAEHFRTLGIKTKNDSTRFLSDFGRLMFGSLESKHLDHRWHKDLHNEDRVLYFPKELSMVYRTALLLRGLAMSLQFNPSVGEAWRHHALEAIKHGSS